jgi:AraC family transcriptional regulator
MCNKRHDIKMTPTFKTLPSLVAIGFETTFIPLPHADFNGSQVIPPLWNRFLACRDSLTQCASDVSFGVIRKDHAPDTHEMRYLACAHMQEDAPTPEGMVRIEIPQGRYAVFTHTGKLDTYSETLGFIYGVWLPSSGQSLRDAPHLEWYDERFIYDCDASECDVYIPIV